MQIRLGVGLRACLRSEFRHVHDAPGDFERSLAIDSCDDKNYHRAPCHGMLLCRYRAAINHSTGHSRAAGLLRVFSGEGVEARNFASKHLTSASARGKLRTAFCSTLLPCEETPSSGGTGRVWSQPARKFGYPQTRPYTSTASDSRFAFTLEHLHHNNPALILSLIRKSLLDEATLLSLSPPTSSTSLPPTPLSCLMCLYVTLKESYPAQLQFLSNAELSSLISLFGSASLTDSKAFSCIHANSPAALHPFASTLPRTVYSSHWDMVTEIGRDKEVMFGRKLNHSDHYWLMRAAIHKESTERPSLSVAESHLYFANARRHYYPIRSRLYPEIHIPYIRALLSCPPSAKRPATEALLRTCSILRESWTDSDLQTCFWESVRRVSGFDRSQTRAVREEALRCLGRKIRKKEITTPWKISPSRPGCYTAKSRNRSPGDISSRSDGPLARPPQTTPVTIHELHSLLCAELLCTPSHLSQVNPWLASWALLHLRSEFPGPDRRQPGVERAWRALALLSLGLRS
ncbi:hypothetical protein BOTBODRAFT_436081 [Botryobasidium botryosum FD-172 SS1]|uniref:Uncharacterized protein n=1 Tax=Botryobasidium botryosum (strain FD-172 SS1) TaxID=930990 RepID=A0A067MUT3_BOTB1|nr:hypothetical protein BOTBODRAFT_436081 [Botryobasidium botryosum FD-172 SS1]